ncbi:MAG: tetratricopeptide repeat protein [Nanoarchaeota archaeon]|nr:tetratricopeptide repeat protein [Nanoarchaeota archaeon]
MEYDQGLVQDRVGVLKRVIRNAQPFLAEQALELLIAIPDDEIKFEALTEISDSVTGDAKDRLESYFGEYGEFLEKAEEYCLKEGSGPMKSILEYREAINNKDLDALMKMKGSLPEEKKVGVDFVKAIYDGNQKSLDKIINRTGSDSSRVKALFSILDHFSFDLEDGETLNKLAVWAYDAGDNDNGLNCLKQAFEKEVATMYTLLTGMLKSPEIDFDREEFDEMYSSLSTSEKISILRKIDEPQKNLIETKVVELENEEMGYKNLIDLAEFTNSHGLSEISYGFYKRAVETGKFDKSFSVLKDLASSEDIDCAPLFDILKGRAKKSEQKLDLAGYFFEQEDYDSATELYKDAIDKETTTSPGFRVNLANKYVEIGRISEAAEFLEPLTEDVKSLEDYVTTFKSGGVDEKLLKALALEGLQRFNSEEDIEFIPSYFSTLSDMESIRDLVLKSEELREIDELRTIVNEFDEKLEEVHSELKLYNIKVDGNLSFMTPKVTEAVEAYQEAKKLAGEQPDTISAEKLQSMKLSILDGYAGLVDDKLKSSSYSNPDISKAKKEYKSAVRLAGEEQDSDSAEKLYAMKLKILDTCVNEIERNLSSSLDSARNEARSAYEKAQRLATNDKSPKVQERLQKMQELLG